MEAAKKLPIKKGSLLLAPIAGASDAAFRLIARDHGADAVYTEMISAKALTYRDKRTAEMLEVLPGEGPVGVQLFGHEPEVLSEAARMVSELGRFAMVDLNMGCPAPKIVKNGEGSALLLDMSLAGEIMRAVVRAADLPVTVKMRRGFDDCREACIELAKRAEAAGVKAVTVHGRTREQYYSGKADWSVIRRVKEAVSIPVIGNGDVFSGVDAKRMLEETGCDAIMIARGALGNPFLFEEARAALSGGEPPRPSGKVRALEARRHMELLVGLKGEARAMKEARGHMMWYIKGFQGAAALRREAASISCFDDIDRLLERLLSAGEGGEGHE